MGLIEHESKGHNEELIALIVADIKDPVTPILEAALVGEGLYDAGRAITRLSEVQIKQYPVRPNRCAVRPIVPSLLSLRLV